MTASIFLDHQRIRSWRAARVERGKREQDDRQAVQAVDDRMREPRDGARARRITTPSRRHSAAS